MNRLIFAAIYKTTLIAILFSISFTTSALDKNGNFESLQEQDAFIATTLKKMAIEMNSQAPIQIDSDTRMMSVIALQKTLNFNMILVNYKVTQINAVDVENAAKENLNDTVCKNKSTRNLIDMGVKYVYEYRGNDNKLVAKVVIDRYKCQ